MRLSLKKQLMEFISLVLAVFVTITAVPFAYSQTNATNGNPVDGIPVVVGDDQIFVIQARIGSFSVAERSQAVNTRLQALAEDVSIPVTALKTQEEENSVNILAGEKVLFTVTEADAKAAGKLRQELAREYTSKIQTVIKKYRQEHSLKYILFGVFYSVIATITLLILFKLLHQGFARIFARLNHHEQTVPAMRIDNFELLSEAQVASLLTRFAELVRLALWLCILAVYFTLVISFFPWTRGLEGVIVHNLVVAVKSAWEGFLAYLPKLLMIAVIIVVTYYILRFTRLVLKALGRDRTFPWFYPEWAEPTYKLATFLIIALAAVVVFPYLPGAKSPAFQGISIFLGLLLSLGSSAAVANIVAGVILIYTRSFQVGNRVKIGDAIGDVAEKTLLVTRIRTVKNVVITIPNSTVLNSQVTNYSALVQDSDTPLVLHTKLTLRYDIPWRKVHEVLINAGLATQHILKDPTPFVLQTSLDDFYVSYELNAHTKKPHIMARIYSELHQNIQDKCNEAGIEILSPQYYAIRDGNQITIPENYLSQDYTAPGFKISSPSNGFNQPDSQK
ncbi:mechanosensitive ion channel family protein [Brasilonema octagenarum UFV-OR1]|uniref:Mechanosensitive ion channel family protein n=2 Tax=Octagenarum group TaxID=3398494 RepID=A0ABX1M3R9_9CYAN|nr:mechanosensitive ion channel family protein [Brasilonema octagenarum UFV-OR1]